MKKAVIIGSLAAVFLAAGSLVTKASTSPSVSTTMGIVPGRCWPVCVPIKPPTDEPDPNQPKPIPVPVPKK